MNKPHIRRSFDRAAASYDSAAALQRRVCQLLLEALPDAPPRAILDAGCGTGHGRRLLARRWPGAHVTAADFAPAMLARAGGGVCADIEALPFANGSFDLYWSSLTMQWCDARRVLGEAARALAPGGTLAFSSLGPKTLTELRDAFAGSDSHRHVLEFSPAADLAAACTAAGFENVECAEQILRLHHADTRTLMRELKALGANQVGRDRRPGLLGRNAWLAVERRYESRREAAGLPVSYEVILCTARKPIS